MGIEFGLDTIGDIAGDQGRRLTGEEALRLLTQEAERPPVLRLSSTRTRSARQQPLLSSASPKHSQDHDSPVGFQNKADREPMGTATERWVRMFASGRCKLYGVPGPRSHFQQAHQFGVSSNASVETEATSSSAAASLSTEYTD